MRQITRSQIGATAEDAARQLRDTLLAAGRGPALRRAIDARVEAAASSQSVILLIDRQGRFVAGNLADWPPTVTSSARPATIELFRIDRDMPERMRVIATGLPDGTRLLTGHVVERELQFARAMEWAMAIAMAMAVAFAGLAGWAAARMIEARLRRTIATAEAVAAGDLTRRVAVDGGDDAFEALGVTVNAMLDRIAALVGELKMATDGLAHDLRSPLTRMRATLERALAVATDEAGRAAVLRAMDEGERLLAMLDTALRITRAEAGLGREAFIATDLDALLAGLAEMYEPLAEERGLTITAVTSTAPMVAAHREMLGQAVANLIDNALKYGAGAIVLAVEETPAAVAITVADRGAGIAPDRRAQALTRFGRLDAARGESGAGLGLSLVAAVAHLHGGTLALEDNAPGLRARLTIAR